MKALLQKIVVLTGLVLAVFLAATSSVLAAEHPFDVPTTGYIGPLVFGSWGGVHDAVDIWTYKNNPGSPPGNKVYLPYEGIFRGFLRDSRKCPRCGPRSGLIFEHNISPSYAGVVPRLHVWTFYFHMANEYTQETYVNLNLRYGTIYARGAFIGRQGNRLWWTGVGTVVVHLHVAVSKSGYAEIGIDPSPYFGLRLRHWDRVPLWYRVVAPAECSLIKGSGPAIYFVEKGEKRWIPNPVTFEEGLRFSWGDVCRISDGELATYPTGPSIPSVTDHWVISHFKGRNLSMPPVIIRGKARGWFDIGWGYGSPDPSIPADNFSSRYVTKFPFESGTYDFRFVTDDGLRFWIDGSQVINAWVDQARVFEVTRSMTKGDHFLRIEHFEGYVTSHIAVSWRHASRFTLIQLPEDDTVVTIKPASGGGLQVVVYGKGGPYRWLTSAYAAIRWVYGFASPVFVSWEQFDKDHSLHLAFLIEGMDGQDRLLVYSANAPNHWYKEGWVDMGPRTPTYNQWETFTRNLEADYIDEFGVAPKLGKEIRIGHFVNDAWVGDHGGTIENISFVEEIAPPVTTISFDPPSPNGENDWYISDVAVTLSVTDPSGIERTEYNLGTGWVTYTGPFVISQEGTTEILYRSIDKVGTVEETRSAVVGLDKTPPVVVIGGPYSGEEGGAVWFDGSASSDEISGIQSYTWEFIPQVEGQETPQPSVYASYTWGDNSSFTASLSVKDLAGWVAEDQTTVPVANISPTAILDRSAMILFPADEAFLTKVGQSFTLEGNVTDPGSDDLELTFDFGEGVPQVQTFLNDPEVGPDPLPSPEINPREVTSSASYEYQDPGIYRPALTVTDDDSGEGLDQDYAVVQDDGTVGIRTIGFWKYQFGVGEGQGNLIPQETLERYLEIADFLTNIYSDLDTVQAKEILTKDEDGNPMRERAGAQYLALLLNFASGSIDWNQLVDTDFDGISDTLFSEAVFEIDTVLFNPDSTAEELEVVKDFADSINNMGDS